MTKTRPNAVKSEDKTALSAAKRAKHASVKMEEDATVAIKSETIIVKSEEKAPDSGAKIVSKQAPVKMEVDAGAMPEVPFEVKEHHKKALLKLLHCRNSNDQVLTYQELSAEIGVGEKTKAWQCVAWKDLKTNEYIIEANRPDTTKKYFKLSDKGIELAMAFATPEDLEMIKMPETNEEHREKVKAKVVRDPRAKKYGPQIFDLLIESYTDTPFTGDEIAQKFNTKKDSHRFFYGFQQLKKMKIVVKANKSCCKNKGSKEGTKKGAKWFMLSHDTAFLRTVPKIVDGGNEVDV